MNEDTRTEDRFMREIHNCLETTVEELRGEYPDTLVARAVTELQGEA